MSLKTHEKESKMPLYSKKTVLLDKICIMEVSKELSKKLNSFQENGIKHVRSVILRIKTIGKIDKNAYTLRYKSKMQEIMFC